ncbi:MAG: glycoside hydrolase family 13 protein [Ruthenibacterium sp.]
MTSIYNSRSAACKTPFGALEHGQSVSFTLYVPQEFGCTTPYILWRRDGESPSLFPLTKLSVGANDADKVSAAPMGVDLFRITMTPDAPGLYFYYFDLYTGYRKLFCGKGSEAFLTTDSGAEWQLTVYEKGFSTPDVLCGGVMYQIFPDRFCEGVPDKPMPFADRVARKNKHGEPYFWPTEQGGYLNMDYYGGDLAGIREKLPYLAELGVTLLYLNPIFEAHSNHRYNAADYLNVDPLLGTNEDFTALCTAAQGCGIRILLDGVFSHTGSDSVYFNREGRYGSGGAYRDANSPYRSWYDFSSAYPCGYRSWWGFETLPEVNESDPSYRNFICGAGGVIDTWLQRGAAGFRLDVADELPDDFIADIRTAVKRHGADKYLLGEVWEDATTKYSYGSRRSYLLGNGLDATMNYPFKEAVLAFCRGGRAQDAAESILRICENYPQPALHVLMNFMSTHDTVRAITALAGESCEGHDRYWQSGRRLSPAAYEQGVRLLRLAYAMIFTLPGIPIIYYGDEIATQGYKDPFNRTFFDWDSTEARLRPMLRELARQRSSCTAFRTGGLTITRADEGILCYRRQAASGNDVAAVCINRTDAPAQVLLLGSHHTVPPLDFLVITQRPDCISAAEHTIAANTKDKKAHFPRWTRRKK